MDDQTKLGRSFIDRVSGTKAKLPEPPAHPADAGIIHPASSAHFAFAERQAVASAMRLLGAEDPAGRAHEYVRHIAAFVKNKPGHAVVQRYVEAAKDPTKSAGPELTEAVKPLVGAVNFLLASAGKDKKFAPPVNTPKQPAPKPAPPGTGGKKAGGLPSGFVSLPHPDQVRDEQLTLDETPVAKEARHETLARMLKSRKFDKEAVIQEFMKVHDLDRRNAQASIRRAAARLSAKPKDKPTKLAAPGKGEPINRSHLVGEAYYGPQSNESVGIDPMIHGTALAYHLRDMAANHHDNVVRHLATHAFAGTTSRHTQGTDAFTTLGERLRSLGDSKADMYNWAHVDKNLALDRWVHGVVQKHVLRPEGMSDKDYWEKVHRQYGSKDNEAFWARIAKEAGGRGPSAYHFHGQDPATIRERVRASINRHADRELDRAYLGAVSKGRQQQDAVYGLKSVFGAAPRGPMKFSREAFEAELGARPHDRNARLAYADWLEENGHEQASKRLKWFQQALEHEPTAEGAVPLQHLPRWVLALRDHHELASAITRHAHEHAATLHESNAALERTALGLHEDHEAQAHLAQAIQNRIAATGPVNTSRPEERMLARAVEGAHTDVGPGLPPGQRSGVTAAAIARGMSRKPTGPGDTTLKKIHSFAATNPPPE